MDLNRPTAVASEESLQALLHPHPLIYLFGTSESAELRTEIELHCSTLQLQRINYCFSPKETAFSKHHTGDWVPLLLPTHNCLWNNFLLAVNKETPIQISETSGNSKVKITMSHSIYSALAWQLLCPSLQAFQMSFFHSRFFRLIILMLKVSVLNCWKSNTASARTVITHFSFFFGEQCQIT